MTTYKSERYKRYFPARAAFPDEERERESISFEYFYDPTLCGRCGHAAHGTEDGKPNGKKIPCPNTQPRNPS